MTMGAFDAVLFDFGGVVTSSPFEAFNRLEAQRGLPRDFIRMVNSINPDKNAWARFERAEIDAAAFDHLFAEDAAAQGHWLEGHAVIACLAGDIRPAMVDAIDAIGAAGLKRGCITNNVRAGRGAAMAANAERAAAFAAVMARFDHVIESSKVGVRKPDPAIYAMMCDALAVDPARCIYLDDLGVNCKPAAAMGMHAIKVTDPAQALAALETALGLRLRP